MFAANKGVAARGGSSCVRGDSLSRGRDSGGGHLAQLRLVSRKRLAVLPQCEDTQRKSVRLADLPPEGEVNELGGRKVTITLNNRFRALLARHVHKLTVRGSRAYACAPSEQNCCYCRRPVDPVRGCWTGHGQMAHSACAWAAEEEGWTLLDLEEGKEGATDASQSRRA